VTGASHVSMSTVYTHVTGSFDLDRPTTSMNKTTK